MSEQEPPSQDHVPAAPAAPEPAFDPAQRELFRQLSALVSMVGLLLMALGIVAILYIGSFIIGHRREPTPLVFAAFCTPMVIVGFWFRGAGNALARIATQQERGMAPLMAAMVELRRVFSLQRWAYVVALAVAVVGLVLREFAPRT